MSTNDGSTAARYDPRNPIQIVEGDITDRAYKELGRIEVSVNKPTIFHRDPTRKDVMAELQARGAEIGADAVIHVRYGSVSPTWMSWGSMDGEGVAVRFTDAKTPPKQR